MSLSPPNSSFSASAVPTDASSNVASLANSTPPTTIADSASLHSEASKLDVITVDVDPLPSPPAEDMQEQTPTVAAVADADAESALADSPARPRRSNAAPVYNLAKLSGTDGHGKRRANGDLISVRRRRTLVRAGVIPEDSLAPEERIAPKLPKAPKVEKPTTSKTIDALNLQTSKPRPLRRVDKSLQSLRNTARRATLDVASLGKLAESGRRSRKSIDKTPAAANNSTPTPTKRVPRELRRLEDTKEFAHQDEQPVVYTVWSNGKYVNPKEAAENRARKRVKKEENTTENEPEEKESSEPITNTQRRVKKYMDKGLYSGQDAPIDISKGLTMAEKKALADLPELIPSGRVNKTMPSLMFTGLRTLIAGRDFKLPFHVCNPMPPGQPKPDEWKKMTKNRFIGESKDIWRKSPHYHDMSKCVCKPEDGCGESCQNRIMLYECDEKNCNVGKSLCTNRAFADLTTRRNKGGKYRVGVEVIKTSDRGYGVRSNRCFEPNQIIMEYAGEIITEEECERRMNEIYQHNECYYLMSFDQNMIIDATTGSIARFVNHSCNPNCRMIKWIVSGQPRMALFAGDRPIMTGDELTYDYNFDPFSAKNVQRCLCGSHNCRGVLGPKPRETKPVIKNVIKETVKAGKRKLQELLSDDKDNAAKPKAKKPRVAGKPITSTKGALANVGMQLKQGAATAIKKGMSSVTSKAKKTAAKAAGNTKQSPTKRRTSTGTLLKKKTTTTRVIKTYGKGTPKKQIAKTSTTVIAASGGRGKATAAKTGAKVTGKSPVKKTPVKATTKASAKSPAKKTPVKATEKTPARKLTKNSGKIIKAITPKVAARNAATAFASPRKAVELTREIEAQVAAAA